MFKRQSLAAYGSRMSLDNRYSDLNTYFRKRFGCRVQKISIDAGMNCPNRDGTISTRGCIYCNQRGSGTGAHAKGISVTDQIRLSKIALSKRYRAKKFIAYFQSFTNTYAPVPRLKQLYDEALAVDDIVGLFVGTRPDCIDETVLDLLEEYAKQTLVWIEYGIQSIHDATLVAINRGHDFHCIQKAIRLTRKRGLNICAHIILGLPNENRCHMIETAKALSHMDIQGVKLHLLYVIKGTGLEALYRQGQYRCLEQREYVDLVCDFLERLPTSMVVQRLTGDPHPNELVAPQWSLRKAETRNMILQTLVDRDSRQGTHFVRKRL